MYFETFQNSCKYRKPGYDIDHQPVDTCRHKENTPPGSSWGTCDIRYCPMFTADFERPMNRGDVIRAMDNEALANFLAKVMDEATRQAIEIAGIHPAAAAYACNTLGRNLELLKTYLDSQANCHIPSKKKEA